MARGPYSPTIFNGDFVKTLKDSLKLGENVKIITGDSDDPVSVAKDAPIGSLYFRDGTSEIYKKKDTGSSTNWVLINDHGDQVGLGDDDHTQYALLNGRASDVLKIDDILEKTAANGVSIDGVLLKDNDVESDEVRTDTISEKTAANGVSIDGVLLKDNDVESDEVRTDTISEKTAANGVSIDGVLLKDNDVESDEVRTDTISEKTAANGVSIDGVLLKDNDVESDEVRTDTISEKTAANGVSIDGVTIKDGGISLNAGATVNDINDEDDMSSDSATALATQQSIKAYVDDKHDVKTSIYTSNAGATFSSASFGRMNFEDQEEDDNSWTTIGGSWLTTPGEAGLYAVDVHVTFNANGSAGLMELKGVISDSGLTSFCHAADILNSTGYTTVSISTKVRLTATAGIYFEAAQSTGGNASFRASGDFNRISITRIGD